MMVTRSVADIHENHSQKPHRRSPCLYEQCVLQQVRRINWSPLNMNGDLLTAGIDLIKKTKKTLSYYTESIADVSSIDFSNNE